MNTNELDERLVETAKFIDSVSSNWQVVRTIELARTMLRQQQAKIQAGKIIIKGYSKVIDEQQAEIEMLKTKLAEWHIWSEYE